MSGCCICDKTIEDNGQLLSVDHCHKTNKIRGLLCSSCNFMIGLSKDSPIILRKAADYLENFL